MKEHILQFFEYAHLPAHLAEVSKPFSVANFHGEASELWEAARAGKLHDPSKDE